MLQDSQIPEVKELLQFDCIKPIKTVYTVLESLQGLSLLSDPTVTLATMEIIDEGKPRKQVQNEIQTKERAIEHLAKKYARADLTSEVIKQCLYSIGDNNSFLRTNRYPCEKMISYLKLYFKYDSAESGHSLAIMSGKGGARLSHGHQKQFQYVLQSLSLWREVLHGL
jgi:Protein of unknown function (DUF2009)